MILAIECVALCILFTFGIFVPLYKNPIGQIMSYPKKIREKVESLPEYKDCIKQKEKNHIVIKVFSIFVFAILLYAVAYFSGAKMPEKVFVHVFVLFFVVNVYDLFIMDLLIFRNAKCFRIKGTEHMDKEYKECFHHVRGFFIGIILGTVVSLLASGVAALVGLLK